MDEKKDIQIGTGTVQADVGTDGVQIGSKKTGSLLLPWNLIYLGVTSIIGLFKKK